MALGFVVIAFLCAQALGNPEHDLASNLLDNYPQPITVRPLEDPSAALDVGLSCMLLNIVDLDEENAVLSVHYWMSVSWTDSNLFWDPDSHNGINQLQMDMSKIWTPQIVGYDSFKDDVTTRLGVVMSSGLVYTVLPVTSHVPCMHEGRTQVCKLRSGSWVTSKKLVSLSYLNNQTSVDMEFFHEHPELTIVSHKVEITEKSYPVDPDTLYQSFQVTLVVAPKRRDEYSGRRAHYEEEPVLNMMQDLN